VNHTFPPLSEQQKTKQPFAIPIQNPSSSKLQKGRILHTTNLEYKMLEQARNNEHIATNTHLSIANPKVAQLHLNPNALLKDTN